MKNKSKLMIVTICISLIAILSIYSYALFHMKDQKKISNPKEVEGLAVLVDGEKTDTFPAKDSGKVFDKIECTNGGVAEWNSDTWKLAVRHINRSTECTVSFITKVPTAVEKLTELAKTSSEMFTDDTADANIRYMGADPANYVDIGNGNDADGNPILWRIIGVMNNIDDGTGNKETRIKLIREQSIGNIAWDNRCIGTYNEQSGICSNVTYNHNWSTSSLNKTLNEAFYNSTKTTDANFANITGSDKWQKLDYSTNGIKVVQNLIQDALYYISGPSSSNLTNSNSDTLYEIERSNDSNSGTWTGKVGLMYPSDYGYATVGGATKNKEECATKALYYWFLSDYADCRANDWLFNGEDQWTMTKFISDKYAFNLLYISKGGYANYNTNNYVPTSRYLVRPVVYLRSIVKITGGEGTKTNPYTLGI